MRKILLVIDDFNELVLMESVLKRVGFDVLALGKDFLLNDALLRFIPDLVIATAKGRVVDGVKVVNRVAKINPQPRVAVTMAFGTSVLPEDLRGRVDAVIETPVQPHELIEILAGLSGNDVDILLEKYERTSQRKIGESRRSPVDTANDADDDADDEEFSKKSEMGSRNELIRVRSKTTERPNDPTTVRGVGRAGGISLFDPVDDSDSTAASKLPNATGDQAQADSSEKSAEKEPRSSAKSSAKSSAGKVVQNAGQSSGESSDQNADQNSLLKSKSDASKKLEQDSSETLVWDPVVTPGKAAVARSARSDRYEKFLIENKDDVSAVLSRDQMTAAMSELKKTAENEPDAGTDQDELRREFVKKLFDDES